jgi:hypothetical protein
MARHLNGVKHPLGQEALRAVVDRVEARFTGRIIALVGMAPAVTKKASAPHLEECRCDACVHAFLEAMEVANKEAAYVC